MEILPERMQERTHHEYHKDPRRGIFAKEHSGVYTFVWTLLFAVVLIVENICHFKLFENCQASIVFYWLESCVIALFFRFWGRKRVRRYVKYKLKVLGYYERKREDLHCRIPCHLEDLT